MSQAARLKAHAEQIWRASIDAVRPESLLPKHVTARGSELFIAGVSVPNDARICVVGAGKAGAGMVAAFEAAVGEALHRVFGLVIVPADCLTETRRITLRAGRPAGVNEPTTHGEIGTQKIEDLLASLTQRDVCVVLISGGGSALLPAPVPGITLDDKILVTRLLMKHGVPIDDLNCVRQHLSRLKGGGLIDATRAGRIISLIISDVVGDPPDLIASGPTVPPRSTASDALAILEPFADLVPSRILSVLRSARCPRKIDTSRVTNVVIGNNETALSAAATTAERLGYRVVNLGSFNTGIARELGPALIRQAVRVRDHSDPISSPACFLSGGEPIVKMAESTQPGLGGRNQELALSAVAECGTNLTNIVLASVGTDGEDGPTDAAGAVIGEDVYQKAIGLGLDPRVSLERHDSYPFLDQTGALIRTGPTGTNVMDVRVVLVGAGS